jgi:ElaB/YqjD/DUF883 family membrane-anchored ribosome-binding protein
MANEDMIGSSVGESSGTHGKGEAWQKAEDLKSAAPAGEKECAETTSAVFDEAKKCVRTLREEGEDYVRTNPMKAVFTALGVGFILGLIFKH